MGEKGSPDTEETENSIKNALVWGRTSPTPSGLSERIESGYGSIDII
jgi:hypothetical protein